MSTNQQILGANVYPNTFYILPGWVLMEPVMESINPDTNEMEMVDIPTYYSRTNGNRVPVPTPNGTHAVCTFEVSYKKGDFAKAETLLMALNLTDGGTDYTLPIDETLAYICTLGEYDELKASSHLFVSASNEIL